MDTKEHLTAEQQLWDFIVNLPRYENGMVRQPWTPIWVEAERLGLTRKLATQMIVKVEEGSPYFEEDEEAFDKPTIPGFDTLDDLEAEDLPELKIIIEDILNQGPNMT